MINDSRRYPFGFHYKPQPSGMYLREVAWSSVPTLFMGHRLTSVALLVVLRLTESESTLKHTRSYVLQSRRHVEV